MIGSIIRHCCRYNVLLWLTNCTPGALPGLTGHCGMSNTMLYTLWTIVMVLLWLALVQVFFFFYMISTVL